MLAGKAKILAIVTAAAALMARFSDGQICNVQNLIDGTAFSNITHYSAGLEIFTDLKVQCAGTVWQWAIVQSSTSAGQTVYLDVWRSPDLQTFTLIGSSMITTTFSATGVGVYQLPPASQFQVQTNDMIGIHYPSWNIPQNKIVVPFLDPEVAQGSSTVVWKYGDADIKSRGGVVNVQSVNDLIADFQTRLPGILAYVTTTTTTTTPPTTTSTPPPTTTTTMTTTTTTTKVIAAPTNPTSSSGGGSGGATTPPPIIWISIGGVAFNWPGVMTPPSLIITSAASAFFTASATAFGRAALAASLTMLLGTLPYASAQTTMSTSQQIQKVATSFSSLMVNGVPAWIIAVVVGVVLLLVIIILIILVAMAFRRRAALAKNPNYATNSHHGHLNKPSTFVQTDFNATYARAGAKVDNSTMTKRSLFTEAPPPARRSEDYYALTAPKSRHQQAPPPPPPPPPVQQQESPFVRMMFNNKDATRSSRHHY